MRSIESDGDSIDQAIDRALRTLQVGRDQVEVEILADATKGLFGFGGKKARVRATVRAPLLSPASSPSGIDSRETSAADVPAPPSPTPRRHPVAAPTRAAVASPARSPQPRNDGSAATVASEAFTERARTFLADLLVHLDVTCSVDLGQSEDPGVVSLIVRGDSGGLLIGRRGQTLDALEYVVNRVAARDDRTAGRVTIDIESYRERRQEYLRALAQRLADKVKQTGRVVTLNPMSPRDRRIVHLTLQDDGDVATRSHGDGHYRKILILPAERSRRGRSRSPEP